MTSNQICRQVAALAAALVLVLSAAAAQAGGWEMYDAGNRANRQGQYEQALQLLTDAIQSGQLQGTELASAYFSRAFAYRSLGDYRQAIDDYDQALKNQPSLAEDEYFYSGRILAYLGIGDLALAEADLDKALALAPESASLINTRGLFLQKKGLYGQAFKDHVRAMELSPQLWEAKANLAWLLATCPDEQYRDGEQAATFAEIAAKVKPDHHTLDVLAAAYAEAGRFDEAVKVMEMAMDILEKLGRAKLEEPLRPHLEAYQHHQPWRQ